MFINICLGDNDCNLTLPIRAYRYPIRADDNAFPLAASPEGKGLRFCYLCVSTMNVLFTTILFTASVFAAARAERELNDRPIIGKSFQMNLERIMLFSLSSREEVRIPGNRLRALPVEKNLPRKEGTPVKMPRRLAESRRVRFSHLEVPIRDAPNPPVPGTKETVSLAVFFHIPKLIGEMGLFKNAPSRF